MNMFDEEYWAQVDAELERQKKAVWSMSDWSTAHRVPAEEE